MLSLSGPLLLLVFAGQFLRYSSIPVEEFIGYPFGSESSNHQILPSNDDSYAPVEIAEPIIVNGIPHRAVYINNNGVLNFQVFTTTWRPQTFPIQGNDHIAPLWTDLDSRFCPQLVNTVFYKEYAGKDPTSLPVFNRIDRMVETVTRCANISFTTTWAFAVTWEEVRYYNLTGGCDKYNTFQVVLATDGVVTFAIMNYARVDTGGKHAMVGVNAGDGINFYAHPNSMTTDIYNIESEPGNTGELGQWVYRVDVISEETDYSRKILSVDGRIHLKPGVGTVFGGTPVIVDGPCVRDPESINCSFADQTEDGLYLGNGQFMCVTPEFTDHKVGRIPFTLSFSSYGEHVTHKSSFHKIIRDPETKMSLKSKTSLVTEEGKIDVTWNSDFLPLKDPQDYKVDIKLFKLDIARSTRPLQYMQTLLNDVPNSGLAQVKIPKLKPVKDILYFVKVVVAQSREKRSTGITTESNNSNKPSLYAKLILEELMSFSCDEWIQAEPDGEDLLDVVTRCPLTEIQAIQLNSNFDQVNFSKASCFQDEDKGYNYPLAEECYQQRTVRSGTTAGNMCCYVNGLLCTQRNCAGTVDKISPAFAATEGDSILEACLKHLQQDILPRLFNCSGYYERRPIDNGTPPVPENPIGFAATDPHIDTLDGHKYTFNGKGEFTLVEAKNREFVLQGRMVSYINTLDSKVSGTVFSAFAAKCSNSDTVQVELNSNSVLIVLVNGEAVSFEDINSLDFRKVTVSDRGNSTISTTFACGAYIEVKEENGIISVVFVSLSKEFRGLTRGLMGNFNGNTSDDLMPNGSDVPISLNSSLKTIHEQFGITWIIQDQASSILTYNDNANWTDFYDPSFIPSFEPVFFNSNLENEAREICDGDKDCLFDIAATGDKNIGRAVKNVNELVERMSELSHPPVCNPDCVHGRCVQNDTCECGSGYEGPICSEIVLPIPSVMCTPWLPFGVFISWTVSSPHTIEGYRLQVFTVSSGGNYNLVKVNELLPHATLSLFPARRGVRYAIQVEARVAGRYGPPGQIMTQL